MTSLDQSGSGFLTNDRLCDWAFYGESFKVYDLFTPGFTHRIITVTEESYIILITLTTLLSVDLLCFLKSLIMLTSIALVRKDAKGQDYIDVSASVSPLLVHTMHTADRRSTYISLYDTQYFI